MTDIAANINGLMIGRTALAIAAIAPGPNLMAVASTALGAGRNRAAMIAAGVATGTLVWAFTASLGLTAIFTAYPWTMDALRIVGGLYLIYLGLRALLAAKRGTASSIRHDGADLTAIRAWRRGLAVIAANPKAALFWASIATLVAAPSASIGLNAVFAFGSMAVSFTVYTIYAVLFSLPVMRNGYQRVTRYVEVVFGSLFCLFGLRLLVMR